MSNDKTAEDFLKEKGIIKEGYSKWICRFEDGKEFDTKDKLKSKLIFWNAMSTEDEPRYFHKDIIELIDQTDTK